MCECASDCARVHVGVRGVVSVHARERVSCACVGGCCGCMQVHT